MNVISVNKHQKTSVGNGWDYRPNAEAPSSIVLHSTGSARPTSIHHEVSFITNSPAVSYHELIAKNGDVYVILPSSLRAWHAGRCEVPFINSKSIGISFHASLGELLTQSQLQAAATRARMHRAEWSIALERIETHSEIALPKGRKQDPDTWPRADFFKWRDNLGTVLDRPSYVIGVPPSITQQQLWHWLVRHEAPIPQVVSERLFTLGAWLEVDPAFVAAVWKHETQKNGRIGRSELFLKSNNAGAIKAYGRWPSVAHNNAQFNVYESPQLGLFALIFHLKQLYGARGILDIDQIITFYAPDSDNNNTAAYIAAVKRSMEEMRV